MRSLLAWRGDRCGMLAVTLLGFLLGGLPPAFAGQDADPPRVLIVVGAPGQPEFGTNFAQQALLWREAAVRGQAHPTVIGAETNGPARDYDLLRQEIEAAPKQSASPLWLVFLGHGTFDGKEARFNLRGPDLPVSDLAGWLKPFQRPLVLINTASASAPFLSQLSGTNRVILTATRTGQEQNYARLGEYLARAISGTDADLDKDGQVSLLEAFLIASRQTAEFYQLEGRLATEHALLDDNGDGQGTQADWFRGLRVIKKPGDKKALVDGLAAGQIHLVPGDQDLRLSPEQRAQRDELERLVLLHREKKSSLPEEEYYRELERLLLQLARATVTVSSNAPQAVSFQ